jgi:hypothetical protein
MIEEYIHYKYNESYFVANYFNTNNIIRRRDISNSENQFEKARCLIQCLKYFAKIDVTTITDLNEHFECIGKSPDHETRCCCSQHEEEGLNSYIIVHKVTQLSFVIGKVCFTNLFNNVPPEQFNKFYQPNCDYCEQKIKMYNKNRPNFCNQKCVKKHREQEERKKIELSNKKWADEAPLREAARLKKWEEEAPIREAQEEEHKKKWEEKNKRIMEANQKYIESQQSKNKKKVYTECAECDKPKYTERQRECELCYDCKFKN